MSCQIQEPTLQYYLDYSKEFSTYYKDQRRGIQVAGKITNTNEDLGYQVEPVIRIWFKGSNEDYSVNNGKMSEALIEVKFSDRYFTSYIDPLGEREHIAPKETLFFVARSDHLPKDIEKVNARLEWKLK